MINNNNASEFTSSTPCEEEDPEPYSLIVIVRSGKIQLQHKASCYRGHGYSNRLIFPAGVHYEAEEPITRNSHG